MANRKPKVSVILLNWNGIDHTLSCIRSLKKQVYKDFEIIVVDNGSTKDDSVRILKKVKGIKLVLNDKNLGFAGGNNVGVENASAEEYVLFLNNDTTVPENWLKEMVAVMDKCPELGEAMPKMYSKYSKKRHVFSGYVTCTHMLFNVRQNRKFKESGFYVRTFYSGGASTIYRRKLVDKPFDEDYFIYGEDVYLGWLLRLRNWQAGCIPTAKVYHEGNATIKSDDSVRSYFTYLSERNRVVNLLTFYEKKTLFKLLPIMLFATVLYNFYRFRKMPIHLKSYVWVVMNVSTILRKRAKIQKQRQVEDCKVMCYMSAKLIEETSLGGFFKVVAKAANAVAIKYAKAVKLSSIESGFS